MFGIDTLLAHPPAWKTSRIGFVTNHAACTADFKPSRQALLAAGFNIVRLFSPEHGLDTTGVDGAEVHDGIDPLTLLPVTSLYGGKLAPDSDDLAAIDVVLFDIPDIGCRFYTYLWTMTYVMEACAAHGKHLVIADRPNPLSGRLDLAEGPMLDEAHCSSFIGRWSIPVRHSCTLGELALYFRATRVPAFSMEVVKCAHWDRSSFHRGSFVPTSPAIPCFESALLYPGLGLLEATNISEGRGTATPFRVACAPWMDGARVASRLPFARPVSNGVMFHVSDLEVFRPVALGWSLIQVVKELYPDHFMWADYPTHVNRSGGRHLDLLLGVLRAEEVDRLDFDSGDWAERVGAYLLYR
ncbi:exo-beta-N-acetylmuramidase NamZ family protein [Chitinophaga lutea]